MGAGLRRTVAGLLRPGRAPDQRAVLCSVAEATSPDGKRHIVEEYGTRGTATSPGWRWVVHAVYGPDGARLSYTSARYKAPGSRGISDIKGTLALRDARSELARHGAVVHRQPCPHCHLGIWSHGDTEFWQHAAHDLPECPDGQGTDCNNWAVAGFGAFPPWPPTGSCR